MSMPFTNFAEVLDRLQVAPARIRTSPAPGTATDDDLFEANLSNDLVCELIDGVLVEKPVAKLASTVALALVRILNEYVSDRDLGTVIGPDGIYKLKPGLVRAPDVSFLSRDRFPNMHLPRLAIPEIAPNVAVELLATDKTDFEIERKLNDYFAAEVVTVWTIDLPRQTANVYTSSRQWTEVSRTGELTANHSLPGFSLSMEELFAASGQSPD